MIAVTFALPAESRSFRRAMPGKAGHRCKIFHTGVGGIEATRRVVPFLETERPQLVVGSGFAGSVSSEWSAGDILIAANYSSPGLRETASCVLAGAARTSTLWTASEIVDSVEDRQRLAREHKAVAVDMETVFIAAECASRSIPILSLRVISDSPHEPFPAPPLVLFDIAKQRTNAATLLAHIAAHPSAVARLIRFRRQIANAEHCLAAALIAVIPHLIES